ncbi:NAD-dependent epimerase/dehydratase family protein [Spiribacter sp. 2438]|uniref:D-erythronate dehydrogenase n=1 Tax=Spiribacter sp. 2438 TaxID=2666185 RepID=UPI0012AF33DB|nr:D-erythronate dehydrogenase [Spiribacter sp. 2438]QGM21771.1 NAD-dependent epimerase/dehydratase family protein [Spiribacter sp. 2438]
MKIAVTGAAGFLGQKFIARVLADPHLPTPAGVQPVEELRLLDVTEPMVPGVVPAGSSATRPAVVSQVGDIIDSKALARLLGDSVDVIIHLAAVVSSAAEADLDLGLRVNLDGTRAMLEACRGLPEPPMVIFASSVAVYGGALPDRVRDDTALTPQSSYGAQKVIGEQLINDFSRRGLIDGRVLRLPTIAVRPGRPNAAASSFASSIIREPLQGEEANLPVPEGLAVYLLSPRGVIRNMVHALGIPAAEFGAWRSVMLPGCTVTVAEMLEALERVGGAEARNRVRWEPDPRIESIVGSWPARFETARATALGFSADKDIEGIIEAFCEDDLKP